jgi:hypothetical protein
MFGFGIAHRRFAMTLWTLGVLAASIGATDAAEPLWRQAMPKKRVPADPDADYTLQESNGPWLIMASSFSGEGAEEQAKALVQELRSEFNLPAFYYAMKFKLEDERIGKGVDVHGSSIRRRYQRGSEVLEHAVLVGEFPAIDDPGAQDLLERIKRLEPKTLKAEGEGTAQSLSAVRQLYRYSKQKLGKPVELGPMNHAFMARNPLLPKEYFTPTGVEPDVAKWNKGLEYSLLKCPKRYSIKVATFRGRSSLKSANDFIEDQKTTRLASEDDPLVVAGDNAHKLTIALREKGWEAYEFHDRHESIVTVGSFDEMQRMPDGRLAPATRDAQIIVYTFGAASPVRDFEQASYKEIGMKDDQIRQVAEKEHAIKEQFSSAFSKGYGEISEGFNPKRFVELPFDIHPQPIEAPKITVSSAYVRQ